MQPAHWLRLTALGAILTLCAACAGPSREDFRSELDPEMVSRAVHEAAKLNAVGQRVWCVPFARNLSGIPIRGNANTWWGQAEGLYARGKAPEVGAVMTFKQTSRLPMGHVAVVSKVVSDREILVDHANWHRSKVSLGMSVKDVSDANDWSAVRLETNPGSYGSVYPIKGFILASDQ